MEKVTGRSDDMMIVRGVNVFPTQIEEQLLKVEGLAPHYQVVLDRSERLDTMTIVVEATKGCESDDDRKIAQRKLTDLVKGVIGITSMVEVRETGGVERSMGKARRIIDNRSNETGGKNQ